MSRSASTFLKIARACCCNVSRKLSLLPPWQRNEIRPRVSFRRISRSLLLPALFFSSLAFGKGNDPDEFVDIKSVDKTILIDLRYASSNNGRDPIVRANLKLLQKAMAHGGFYGLR